MPAALYKAMGGFATNGVNMLKLESYIDPTFQQALDKFERQYDAAWASALTKLRAGAER